MEKVDTWDLVLNNLSESFEHILPNKTRQELANFCVKNPKTRNAAENYLKTYKKPLKESDDNEFKKILKQAVVKYRNGDYKECIQLYNEAIFNIHNEKYLPLIYANRALAFWKIFCLRECKVDIDLTFSCIKSKFVPLKLVYFHDDCVVVILVDDNKKPFGRQDYLHDLRRQIVTEHVVKKKVHLPELAGGENENFAYASKYLSVHYDETRGRHVIATNDIKIGDVLVVEKTYAMTWFPKECQNCKEEPTAPILCSKCLDVIYCSPQCRDEFWKQIHSFECGATELFKSVGICHVALRIVLNASSTFNELKENLKNIPEMEYRNGVISYNSKGYDSVYRLAHNNEKYTGKQMFSYAMTSFLLALYMKNYTNYFTEESGDEDLELLTSVICLHITQLVCNGSSVTNISFDSEKCKINDFNYILSNQVQKITGVGIYPSLSMFNHSCEPSIIIRFYKHIAVARAVKDIKKGEEVFNCYGPNAKLMKTADRQEKLAQQYFFHCKCTTCSKEVDFQDILQAFKCNSCGGPSIGSEENTKNLVCLSCDQTSEIALEVLLKQMEFISLYAEEVRWNARRIVTVDTESDFNVENSYFEYDDSFHSGNDLHSSEDEEDPDASATTSKEEALKKFLNCWLLGREIFYAFNENLFHCASEVGLRCALCGDLKMAISFSKCTLIYVEKIYGSCSIELSWEMVKVSELIISYNYQHLNKEDDTNDMVQEALLYLDTAKKIQSLLYGCDFDGIKQIENLRKYLVNMQGKSDDNQDLHPAYSL